MASTIRAELRYLHCPGVDPLKDYRPDGPFGICIQAIVGPLGDRGEESFDFMLCTPEWFVVDRLPEKSNIVSGRHFVFVREFDFAALERFVREYCASCEGKNWTEAAEKVARLGHWEFEDYRPYRG